MAFLALGGVITAVLFQTGRFNAANSDYVWAILAGSAVGLLAQTLGRLYSSAYYALRDTRTPLRFAIVRVILTTGLGYLCAIPLPRWIGIVSVVFVALPVLMLLGSGLPGFFGVIDTVWLVIVSAGVARRERHS